MDITALKFFCAGQRGLGDGNDWKKREIAVWVAIPTTAYRLMKITRIQNSLDDPELSLFTRRNFFARDMDTQRKNAILVLQKRMHLSILVH